MDSVVGTVTALVEPAVVRTVTVVPLTAVTTPLTNDALGFKLGAPDGRAAPDGKALGDPPPPPTGRPGAQEPATGWLSRTVVAVTTPVASFWPAITTHTPATMSPGVPVLFLVLSVVVF
jgi:hypothetical protein